MNVGLETRRVCSEEVVIIPTAVGGWYIYLTVIYALCKIIIYSLLIKMIDISQNGSHFNIPLLAV